MEKNIYIVVIAICFTSLRIDAQEHRNGGQRPAVERVESLKKVRMMEALKLDENQSVKVFARYNNHRESMHALENESRDLFNKLDAQIQANASDAEFNQLFSSLLEVEKKRYEIRTKFIADLRDVLTTKQIAEYIVFERSFARDLREAMWDLKKDGKKNR